jgi:hypothetical protein
LYASIDIRESNLNKLERRINLSLLLPLDYCNIVDLRFSQEGSKLNTSKDYGFDYIFLFLTRYHFFPVLCSATNKLEQLHHLRKENKPDNASQLLERIPS